MRVRSLCSSLQMYVVGYTCEAFTYARRLCRRVWMCCTRTTVLDPLFNIVSNTEEIITARPNSKPIRPSVLMSSALLTVVKIVWLPVTMLSWSSGYLDERPYSISGEQRSPLLDYSTDRARWRVSSPARNLKSDARQGIP